MKLDPYGQPTDQPQTIDEATSTAVAETPATDADGISQQTNPLDEHPVEDAKPSAAGGATSTTGGHTTPAKLRRAMELFSPSFYSVRNLTKIADRLNFHKRPRRSRDGKVEIEIHERKQPNELIRMQVIDFCNRVGYETHSRTKQSTIQKNVSKILLYDHGYRKPSSGGTGMIHWLSKLDLAYRSGADPHPLAGKQSAGRTAAAVARSAASAYGQNPLAPRPLDAAAALALQQGGHHHHLGMLMAKQPPAEPTIEAAVRAAREEYNAAAATRAAEAAVLEQQQHGIEEEAAAAAAAVAVEGQPQTPTPYGLTTATTPIGGGQHVPVTVGEQLAEALGGEHDTHQQQSLIPNLPGMDESLHTVPSPAGVIPGAIALTETLGEHHPYTTHHHTYHQL